MVKVSIYRNQNDQITSCKVDGHANAGKKGEDIVCAAVSALTETALLGLGRYLKTDLDYNMKPGLLSFTLKDSPSKETDAILETMLIGLTEIAKGYSNNVRIEHFRR